MRRLSDRIAEETNPGARDLAGSWNPESLAREGRPQHPSAHQADRADQPPDRRHHGAGRGRRRPRRRQLRGDARRAPARARIRRLRSRLWGKAMTDKISGFDSTDDICWHFREKGAPSCDRRTCPVCSTKVHDRLLVGFGRCRSGKRWFWVASTWIIEDRLEAFGWAATQT